MTDGLARREKQILICFSYNTVFRIITYIYLLKNKNKYLELKMLIFLLILI